jgi:predicted glycosyltransferase
MKGEILPTLRRLRESFPQTEVHLNLRDILDDGDVIRELWREKGVPAVLNEYYDAIHVYGSRDVYDAVSAYDLPPAKTEFLGYLGDGHGEDTQSDTMPVTSNGAARILVTIGGGGDGHEILSSVVALQRFLGLESPYLFHIVTGPLMAPAVREDIVAQLRGASGMTLHEYVAGLPQWMNQCDLVLSMGGYNTMCEVMAHAKRSLVIPRRQPRVEQVLRADALAARGLLRVLSFEDLSPATLHGALRACLEQDPVIEPSRRPPLNGLQRLQQRLAPSLGDGAVEPLLPAVSLAEEQTSQSLSAASDAGAMDPPGEEWA